MKRCSCGCRHWATPGASVSSKISYAPCARPPAAAARRPVIRYETKPGEQLQFDWGEFVYEQYGPRLRALCVYLVEQQLVPYGRVRELVGDVFAARLSEGTLVAWVQQGAATLAPVEAALKAALVRVPVLSTPM